MNAGVPSLPPATLGYRHFAANPLYFYHGQLFHVPASENEHGVFSIAEEALDVTRPPNHPRGGHNYYNNRDLEGMARKMWWVNEFIDSGPGWESKYLARVDRHSDDFFRKAGKKRQ